MFCCRILGLFFRQPPPSAEETGSTTTNSPFSFSNLERLRANGGVSILGGYKLPAAAGSYPVKVIQEAEVLLTETDIRLKVIVFPVLNECMKDRVRGGARWLDGEYPAFNWEQDSDDINIYYFTYNLQMAIEDLGGYTQVGSHPNAKIVFLNQKEKERLVAQLEQKVITVLCEKKRHGSFDDHLIQYPVYQVFFYKTSNDQSVMELVTHNVNEGSGVAAVLHAYSAPGPSPDKEFSWQLLAFNRGNGKQMPGGIIRITGDLTAALDFLAQAKMRNSHCRMFQYAYSHGGPDYSVEYKDGIFRDGIFNPDKRKEMTEVINSLTSSANQVTVSL